MACETVLWDTVCSNIFVRNDNAKMLKCPSRERHRKVCTLRVETKEIDEVIYVCKIRHKQWSYLSMV